MRGRAARASARSASPAKYVRVTKSAFVATGANLLHSIEKPRNAMRGERNGAIGASGPSCRGDAGG
jgi:hypothetical protein